MKSSSHLLGFKALVGFTLLALAPIVLLVVLPLRLATNALTNEATQRVGDSSSLNADLLGRQMMSVTVAASELSIRPEMSLPVTAESSATHPARTYMAEMRRLNPSIRSAALISPDGKAVVFESETRQLANSDLSTRQYFKDAVATNSPVVSGVVTTLDADPSKIIVAARAVRQASTSEQLGAVIAVVTLTIDVSQQWQPYVDRYQSENGVSVSVYDQYGKLAAAPGLGKMEGAVASDPRLFDARDGRDWAGLISEGETPVVKAYSSDPISGWTVVSSAAADDVLAPVTELERSTYVIAAFLAAILLLAAVWIGKSLRGRFRAELTLTDSERKTRMIFESTALAYLEADANGVITDWNENATATFLWNRHEVVGKSVDETLLPEHDASGLVSRLDGLIPAIRGSAPNIRTESVATRSDGVVVPVEMTLWTTTVDNEVRLNALLVDISERTELERERERVVDDQQRLLEELQAADQVKSDFISTISHELRTPLTSIVGYLEMFEDGYGGELTERQSSMLGVINRNSKRLLGLIEDILTLTRIESGNFRLELAPVSVMELIQGVQQAMIPAARDRQLDFVVEADNSEAVVSGDYEQLERMLFNLTSNAIKFTPVGGRVTLTTSVADKRVSIRVNDTGIGIPVSEQHRLFTRFFRSSTASAAAIQGTGLGLTIVKTIVERHGGRISIESEEQVGTTVIVVLPLEEVAAKSGAMVRH